MARHANLTRRYELEQIAAAAAPALFDLADAAPARLPDSVRRGPAAMEAMGAAAARQIVFIEGNVPDLQDLLHGLAPGVQAVVLNTEQDGVQQIAAYLTSHTITDLAGIDLVAHGADGVVELGTATLSTATLAGYQTQLAAIGAALAPGGAIQIYGCDVGEDAAGVAFLDRLSQATGGANIAAAPHLVGDAAGGGSFDLNVNVGTIDVATPFTTDALTSFKGELSLSTTVPQLYVVWSEDANGPTTVTRLEQLGINGTTFVSSGSIDLADASTLDINQLRGVAFDAPLDRYFLSQAADQSAHFDSAILFEGTIGAVAAPGTINISASSSVFYTGLSFDSVANKVYVAEQVYSGLTSGSTTPMTSTIDGIGIYSFTPSATITAPITPTLVIYGHSTIAGGGTLQGPTQIAVVPNTNLLIFGDDQEIFLGNGSAHIDVGNVLSHQWTTLAIPGSIISTGVDAAAGLSVAVDATSATGGILFFTVESGTTANNGIYSAGYTITGAGTTQSASINTGFSTLYAGAAAHFPTDIVLNPIVNNGTVTGNGTFYVSSTNGTIYAGTMAGGGTLTAVGDLAASGASAAESLDYESTPNITAAGTASFIPAGTAVTLDAGLAVANTDGQEIVSATVVISGFVSGDTLAATVGSTGITQSYSTATGILTLSGTTTAANYQTVLDTVTFKSTSSSGSRVIDYDATDGVVIGNTATSNVTIAAAIALTAGGTVSFTGGGAAVHLDSATTVSGTGNITGATIDINAGFVTGDLINFSNTLGVTGSYSSGTLTLSGVTTAANYQTALDSITYSFTPANGDPTDAGNKPARTIAWDITDAGGSATATSTVDTQFASVLHYGTTIVETGILAATETVAVGVMTLKNGGSTVVGSITVGSSLVTSDFTLATVSGNTDIILDTVFGTYSSGVTLLTNPTTISSTGSISDSSAAESYGALTGAVFATITNAGHVTSNRYGIYLRAGGLLTNTGSIYGSSNGVKGEHITAILGVDDFTYNTATATLVNSGSVGGGGYAVQFACGGYVANIGTIDGASSSTGVDIRDLPGTVLNAGSIGGAIDINLTNGGYVSNASTGVLLTTNPSYGSGIQLGGGNATVVNAGHIAAAYAGIYSRGAGSLDIRNSGTIIGDSVASNYSAGIWIYGATSGVTIENSGLIKSAEGSSGEAITIATSAALDLIIDPGAAFVGSVSAFTGATNIIELASGASTGTLSGLGTQFTNFTSLVFDSGSQWTVAGNDSAAGLGTLGISGFTSGDTIDVTGFVAVSRTFASNTLVLTNGSSAHETLHIQGSFSTGNFTIGSDGSGGTDVIFGTGTVAALAYGQTIDEAGVVATSETVAGGTMTLLDGASPVGTIGVGTSLNSGDFILRPDGAGGTDVIVDTVFGTYTSGVTLLTNPTTIASTANVGNTAAGEAAVTGPAGTTWTLTNAGRISETGSGSSGSYGVSFASAGTITNAGSIFGTQAGIALAAGGAVTNQSGGQVTGDIGVFMANGTGATVSNAGSIGGSQAYGVWLGSTGTVTNAFGGVITGSYSRSDGAGVYLGGSGAVTNQPGGTIGGLRGVYVLGGVATVMNAGHIVGSNTTIGAGAAETGAGVYLGAGGSVTNQPGGTISGYDGIYGLNATITVVNTGAILGNLTSSTAVGVDLGAGGSVTNQLGGTISGYSGVMAVGAATVVNAGVVTGNYTQSSGAGVKLGFGGSVTNQSSGTISAFYGIVISGAPGTVLNLGLINAEYTTNGANGVYLQDGGLITNGAAGTNSTATIVGYSGAVRFGASGSDTLINSGTVNGSPGKPGVIMTTGTVINGSPGATGALIESGFQSNAVLIGGAGAVVNYGTMNGVALNGETEVSFGVSLGGSGTVASSISNLGSNALISGYVAVYAAQNATVTNGGTLEATQEFGGTPPIEAVIFGGGTNRLIVDPGAVFIGGVNGSGAFTLAPGGNTTVLGTTGGITTLELASATAAGTLSGLGTQFVGFAAVTIDSGANWTFSGYNALASGVTLTDSGTLTVGGTLPVGGTFSNAGLVTGAANGIVLATGGQVTNQSGGIITGTTDGIKLTAGGTITNQAGGTISGGTDAVQFAAGVTNRLVVAAGAVFIGSIVAAGTSTLELTSAAGAGSITGVGTTVTNFTSLVFDAGAAWTVGGDDAANGLGTLGISGFTVGDTIDLNSFSAVNRTFASNTLVLGNGIGGYETLHIQGNFGAGNFHLTQAGGDTDVTFLNVPVVTAGGTVTFTGGATGGGSAVALDTGLTVSELGSTTLVSATISFGTGFIAGDTLNFTAQHAITGSFSSGILTLTGSDTLADYQAALRSITYSFVPGNGDPTGGGADLSRLIDWSVNDGTVVSNTGTSTLNTVHTAPTVTASGTVSFAGGGSAIALDAGFVVTDPDSAGAISSATISIGTGFLSGDLLNFSAQNGITGGYTAGTGILTLSGTATIANYQAALRSITYSFSPANGDPTHGGSDTSRIIGWRVTDGSSSNGTSNTGTSGVHTTAASTLIYGETIAEVGIVATTETVAAGVMTLKNAGGTTVGSINVGTSLVTNDFTLVPIAGPGTDVIVDTVFGTYSSGVTLLVNPTTIASTAIVDNTAAGGVAVSGPGGTAWTLTNLGSVAETGVGAGVGIAFTAAGTIINSGGISGNATVSGGAGISLAAGGVVSNQSGGTISGWYGIYDKLGPLTLTNVGSIGGTADGIALTAGGTIANQSGGVITGYQGIADQRTIAVSNYGSIGGNWTASGGAGLYLILGATVVNHSGGAISGFTGAYVYAASVVNAGEIAGNAASGVGVSLAHGSVLTNQSGGTISGGADAVKFAFGGNGRLVDDPDAVFTGTVDGGNPIGGASTVTLELASGASAGTLAGLGSKYIGFGAVTVDTGAHWTFSSGNTVVSGVTLTNGGTLTATGVLINAGTLTGNMLRLNGASLTNQAGGLVSAAYVYGVGTGGADGVANSGTITSGGNIAIYLKAAGDISNAAGAVISGYAGGVKLKGIDATLGNLGLVASTGSLVTSYGAYLRNGGLVTNGQSGAGTSTASIQGYYGLTFKSADTDNAYGTLINYGTVLGSGTATGDGALLDNGGTVVNGQGGATAALIEGSRYGVSSNNGPVTNGATISATGTQGGDYGVAIQAYGSVGNFGTASLIEGYGGVLIGTDGTVANAGTIESNQGTAGVAVKFTDGNTRLIDDPGAVFIGSIYGGSGGTAVLELATGSSAGVIVGLSTSVTNFTSLVFDDGAQWTVAGNDAANGLGRLGISGFTPGDTIELTGFVAANHTFASNVLTLGDGVGDYETLHIPGGFVTGDFHTAVAGGNTDVTFQVPPTIAAGGTVTFDGGGAAVVLDSTLTVGDPNGDGNPTGATIIVGGPLVAGDTLNFGTLDGITGSYDNLTRTLTLTGTASALDYQAALDSIAYSFAPSNGDPTDGGDVTTRTISWTVDDGVASSTTGSSTLDLVHVAPTVIVGGTVTFIGGGGAVALDGGLTVSDPDSGGLLNGGAVSIDGFISGDILSVSTADLSAIIANYNTTTGTLTLSGSHTLADYQAVLDSVTYSFAPSNGDPTDGDGDTSRSIDWTVTDGVASSTTGGSTLHLMHVGATVIASGTVSYAAGGAAAVLDPGITVSDPDSGGLLSGGSVTITDGTFSGDGDVLTADTTGTFHQPELRRDE